MRKVKIDRKVQSAEICATLLQDPLQQKLIEVLAQASDAELTALGEKTGAVMGVLIRWGKKAAFGLESTDSLRDWFLNEHVPEKVQAFLVRAVEMVNK